MIVAFSSLETARRGPGASPKGGFTFKKIGGISPWENIREATPLLTIHYTSESGQLGKISISKRS
jgi:hypothetical protein